MRQAFKKIEGIFSKENRKIVNARKKLEDLIRTNPIPFPKIPLFLVSLKII